MNVQPGAIRELDRMEIVPAGDPKSIPKSMVDPQVICLFIEPSTEEEDSDQQVEGSSLNCPYVVTRYPLTFDDVDS